MARTGLGQMLQVTDMTGQGGWLQELYGDLVVRVGRVIVMQSVDSITGSFYC